MGASYLETMIKAENKQDFLGKMNDLFKEDRAYYGSNPYSGSWATMDGVLVISDPYPEMKWSEDKYKKLDNYLCDNTQKWENAKAIKTPKGYMVGGWAAS